MGVNDVQTNADQQCTDEEKIKHQLRKFTPEFATATAKTKTTAIATTKTLV